jgi:hypothetical protein
MGSILPRRRLPTPMTKPRAFITGNLPERTRRWRRRACVRPHSALSRRQA